MEGGDKVTKLTKEQIEDLANKLLEMDDASRAAAMVAVDVLHASAQLREEKRDERREEKGSSDECVDAPSS